MEHFTIKELPDSEKPYEKCLKKGVEFLSDAELLAVIIKSGTVGESSVELALKVLNAKKSEGSLCGVAKLSLEELMSIKGIGKVKAIQILSIVEFSKRLSQSRAYRSLKMDSPASIAAYYMERMRHKTQEELLVAMFNAKNRLICDTMVSKGTVSATMISNREIFVEALRHNAVNIVLLHNHPSGEAEPSEDDILATSRVAMCGGYLGITVIDHIIIGDNVYYSFRENGEL